MKKLVLFLFGVLFLGSGPTGAAEQVDIDDHVADAMKQTRRTLAMAKCKAAFMRHMPGVDKDSDLVAAWDEVKIQRVEWITKMPFARGATQCDISQDTFLLSDGYIGWTHDSDLTVEVMIHEFVHLLRCPSILAKCGTQANCQPSFIVNEERLAYKIGEMCTS